MITHSKISRIVFTCLLFVFVANHSLRADTADVPQPGKQVALEFRNPTTCEKRMGYLLFLPDGYCNRVEPWPVILFLHGAGERGGDLQLVKKHGPPMFVEKKSDFPFVVVSPQCPKERNWSEPEMVALVGDLLDDVVSNYHVDESRIYLTGLSMGGSGTWALASAQPDRFAAIVPICGGRNVTQAAKLDDVPIWAFVGAKDKPDTVAGMKALVAEAKKVSQNVKLTIYPDLAHNSWTVTYDNPKLYEWMLKQRIVIKNPKCCSNSNCKRLTAKFVCILESFAESCAPFARISLNGNSGLFGCDDPATLNNCDCLDQRSRQLSAIDVYILCCPKRMTFQTEC